VATSVHIPKPLLAAVDRKAKELRISRNRLIVRALEREVSEGEWSPMFLERLMDVDDHVEQAVDDMATAIQKGRRSKPPVKL
jgi:metal-responsive CopG/Arc/MetJ family transcriptional regulator